MLQLVEAMSDKPAKRAKAYSLGWSEALRAEPWVSVVKESSPRSGRESSYASQPLARFARQLIINDGPRVPLAKPRFTLGYML